MHTSYNPLSLLPNILARPRSPRLRALILLFTPLHRARCVLDPLVLAAVATGCIFLVS